MKTKSNFSHSLFVATMIIGLVVLVFSSCPNDSSSSAGDGTITVRLINAGAGDHYDFVFGVFNVGDGPAGTALAGGVDMVDGDTAEAVAEDGGAAVVFSGGSQYEIYAFVDLNGSGTVGPNSGDYAGGPYIVEVDGNTTRTLDYNDFTPY